MPVIDMDSHLRDGYFLDQIYDLDGEYADLKPKKLNDPEDIRETEFAHTFNPSSAPHDWIYFTKTNWFGSDIAERQQGGYDMDRRVADNDVEGIDLQFLFPTQIGIPALEPGPLGLELARRYNNWAHELVRGHEDRLSPVAIAPAGHPEAMADELRRCVNELGCKAGHLVSYTRSQTIEQEDFHPYYQAAVELGVPLYCHPNSGGPSQSMYKNHYLNHVLGRPFNCSMALIGLVGGGVFKKFPDLKVVFFECTAEWILYWMHRMDDDFAFLKNGFCELKENPSEFIKRNVYVTCEADERPMNHVFEEFPVSHVLMASDYPHYDTEFPNTVSGIRARGDLTAKQKDMILGENAAALLGF